VPRDALAFMVSLQKAPDIAYNSFQREASNEG
jgi:hypothetical protein